MTSDNSFFLREVPSDNPREKKILEIIRHHKNGISASELVRQTGYSRVTVEKILQKLLLENEIYYKEFGQVRVFYPNHRPHYITSHNISLGLNRIIFFDYMENEYGKFIRIVEKKKIDENKWQTMGSLIVPEEALDKFIDGLQEFIGLTNKQKEKFNIN